MARHPQPRYWKDRDIWHCVIDGRRHVWARGRDNRKAAFEAFHKYMLSRGQGPRSGLTVADLCDAFLSAVEGLVESGERAPLTLEHYIRCLSRVSAVFGARPATGLRPFEVAHWAADRQWSPTTAHNTITVLKAAYRWAHRVGVIPEDPLARLDKPTPRRRAGVPSQQDITRALAAIPEEDPFRDFFILLWATGCRPGELAGVEAAHVDRARRAFTVRDKIRRTTGRDTRTVRYPSRVAPILARLCAANPDGPILRTSRGKPWTRPAWTERFRRLRRRLGLGAEFTAYGLRHRFGTDLAATAPTAVVAAAMGHRDTRTTTSRYVHPDAWDDRTIGDAVERSRSTSSDSCNMM